MASKSRVRNLSTRFLKFYKLSVMLVLAGFILMFLWTAYQEYLRTGRWSSFFRFPLTFGYLIFLWYRVNRSVHHVEFDDEFLYVILNQQDLVIPLENIKDVNLVSLGGVYRIDLYTKDLIGDKFYFKPSLLYPFNHKKKEAVVNILWGNINRAKQKSRPIQRNALHS